MRAEGEKFGISLVKIVENCIIIRCNQKFGKLFENGLLEYVYGSIGDACCTASKWIFDANWLKGLSLRRTPLNTICRNENDNYTNKEFSWVCTTMMFAPKYGNIVK